MKSAAPGTWAAAIAARDVVLHPVVPAVAIPIGVDLTRAAVAVLRDLAGRYGLGTWLGAEGRLTPTVDRMREVATGERDLESVLGFDPIALLREALHEAARDAEPDESDPKGDP